MEQKKKKKKEQEQEKNCDVGGGFLFCAFYKVVGSNLFSKLS